MSFIFVDVTEMNKNYAEKPWLASESDSVSTFCLIAIKLNLRNDQTDLPITPTASQYLSLLKFSLIMTELKVDRECILSLKVYTSRKIRLW